jgi:hypothetical protein
VDLRPGPEHIAADHEALAVHRNGGQRHGGRQGEAKRSKEFMRRPNSPGGSDGSRDFRRVQLRHGPDRKV